MDDLTLCELCLNLSPSLFNVGKDTLHPLGTIGEITQRAQSGCALCLIVENAVTDSPHFRDSQLKTRVIVRSEYDQRMRNPHPSWLVLYAESHRLCRLKVTVDASNLRSPTGTTAHPSFDRRPLAAAANTWQNFGLITRWLLECRKRHKDCNKAMFYTRLTGFKLPTRLIDLTDSASKDMRLISTETLRGAIVSYTALSHSWGIDSIVPKCTKDNVRALHQRINFEELPTRYQDAVEVTRALGLRYLWIDSLCIIQDDKHDNYHEIGIANLIYSNAACMIAACDSQNVMEGIFMPRPRQEQKPPRKAIISLRPVKGKQQDVLITVWPRLSGFTEAINNGPMSSRGWCFQERELSPRIIHFTQRRILWECREAIAFEDEPDFRGKLDVDEAIFGPWRTFDCTSLFTDLDSLNRSGYTNGLEELSPRNRRHYADYTSAYWLPRWLSVIEEFSSRHVTFGEDRLNALVGLATIVAAFIRPHDRYMAGLWYADLPRQLLWAPDFKLRPVVSRSSQWPPPMKRAPFFLINSDKFRQPSWSWISVDEPVFYPYLTSFRITSDIFDDDEYAHRLISPRKFEDLAAKIEEAFVEPKIRDLSLGAVVYGIIKITGITFEVQISEGHLYSTIQPPERPKIYRLFGSHTLFGARWKSGRKTDVAKFGAVYFDCDPSRLPRVTLLCLRLGVGCSLLSDEEVEVGLVLMQTKEFVPPGRSSLLFRRVGIFEIGLFTSKYLDRAQVQTVHIV